MNAELFAEVLAKVGLGCVGLIFIWLFIVGDRMARQDRNSFAVQVNQFSKKKTCTPLKKPVHIYLLVDHRNVPFYAGRTNRALRIRLREHISEASPDGGPKQRYIWTMAKGGHKPTIKHVTTIKTTEEDVQEVEARAIRQFGLTNIVVP